MALFQRGSSKLKKIGEKLLKELSSKVIKKYAIEIKKTEVEAGSGSLPLEKIASMALVFTDGMKPSELSRKFRMASVPVLGYIHGNHFHIDLKAIPPNQEKSLLTVMQEVLE